MKAIILAAGRGSRMGDKTDILPKCLTKLRNKSLLEHQLAAIRQAGISDIAVVTGYHAEEIQKRQPSLTFFHNENWANTNMVSTLLKAESWLKHDTCIISYADIVYESSAITALMNNYDDIAITHYTKFLSLWEKRFDNPLDDMETFKISGDGYLTEIGRKPQTTGEVEGQYMGLLKFTPAGWGRLRQYLGKDIPKSIDKIDMTSLLAFILTKQVPIRSIAYDGVWLEVDNAHDLALYESMDAPT